MTLNFDLLAPKVDGFMPFPCGHLCQFASEMFYSFSKYKNCCCCCVSVIFGDQRHENAAKLLIQCLLTSSWPHLRCDVGLEEVCLCATVLCTIIRVHKGTSSLYLQYLYLLTFLQIDIHNVSLGRRQLVNAYEVEAGTV